MPGGNEGWCDSRRLTFICQVDTGNLILGLAALLLSTGTGGAIGYWFKAGPERKKITVDVADVANAIQGKVLDDLNEAYQNAKDETSQLKMQNMALEQHIEDCQKQVHEARMAATFAQRFEKLARSRAHLAGRTLGAYELHFDTVLEELKKHHKIVITPIMGTHKLREAYYTELSRLEEAESTIATQVAEETTPK